MKPRNKLAACFMTTYLQNNEINMVHTGHGKPM